LKFVAEKCNEHDLFYDNLHSKAIKKFKGWSSTLHNEV